MIAKTVCLVRTHIILFFNDRALGDLRVAKSGREVNRTVGLGQLVGHVYILPKS